MSLRTDTVATLGPTEPAPLGPLVTALAAAMRYGTTVTPPVTSLPADQDAAEQAQDALLQCLARPVAAWKIGASTLPVRRQLGLQRQFFGAVLAGELLADGACVPPATLRQAGVEPEWAVIMREDIEPRTVPWTRAELRAAIAGVAPSFELPGSRFCGLGVHGGPALVADNGAAMLAVVGALRPLPDDLASLDHLPVQLSVDGERVASGSAAAIEGGVIGALIEHVGLLHGRGYPLRAGQPVLTGACTPYTPVAPGQLVEATFGAFGTVRLRIGHAA